MAAEVKAETANPAAVREILAIVDSQARRPQKAFCATTRRRRWRFRGGARMRRADASTHGQQEGARPQSWSKRGDQDRPAALDSGYLWMIFLRTPLGSLISRMNSQTMRAKRITETPSIVASWFNSRNSPPSAM